MYCHANMEIRRINVRTSVRDKITVVVLKAGLVYFSFLCQHIMRFIFFFFLINYKLLIINLSDKYIEKYIIKLKHLARRLYS